MRSTMRLPLFAAFFVAALLVAASLTVDEEQARAHRATVREETTAVAAGVRASLESALNRRLHVVRSLAAWVRSQPDFPAANFAIFARELYQADRGIRSIQLAPDSVVTHVYPLAGNEAAVGHDLMADPARRAAVARAIGERQLVLAGPVNLLQGGMALIGRLPIFVDTPDAPEAGRYWGLAIVLVDFPMLLEEAGIASGSGDHALAIRGFDAQGTTGAVFYGAPETFAGDSVLSNVSLPHGGWQLAVRVRQLPAGDWPGRQWFLLASALLVAAASVLTYVLTRRPALLQAAADRAIEAMDAKEKQFQLVAESAYDAIIIADDLGHVRYWNLAATELFGYRASEMLGNSVELLIPAEWREAHRRGIGSAQRAERFPERGKSFEAAAVTRAGTEVPVEVTISGWAIPGGRMFAAIVRDIRARKAAERELHTARYNLSTILDSMEAVVYIADMQSYELLFVNAHGRALFGEIEGQRCWQTLQVGQSGPCDFCTNGQLVDGEGQPTEGVVWLFQNTRNARWFQCHDRAIRWFDGRIVRMEVATDVTERKQMEEKLAQMATHDALTGLPNRKLFIDRLQVALARAKRQRVDTVVMFIDLDGFKPVNDRLGHQAGDQCLREVAERLRACVRESDTVARFGGDEFLLLLSPAPEHERLPPIANKILDLIGTPFDLGGNVVSLRASIGIALDSHGEKDANSLLREADAAMYRVKAGPARGGFAYFDDSSGAAGAGEDPAGDRA